MSGGWKIIYLNSKNIILFTNVAWFPAFTFISDFLSILFYDFYEWDRDIQNAGDSILISCVFFTTVMKNMVLNVEQLLYPTFYFVYFWKKPQLYIYSLHLSTNKTEVLVF